MKAWRNSPEYVAALKNGEKYAKYSIVAVDGVKQQKPGLINKMPGGQAPATDDA